MVLDGKKTCSPPSKSDPSDPIDPIRTDFPATSGPGTCFGGRRLDGRVLRASEVHPQNDCNKILELSVMVYIGIIIHFNNKPLYIRILINQQV